MTATALARPADLDETQRRLLAFVADEYAEGFVEDQYPEHQGGEFTGWDARDKLCLEATAARLRRHRDRPVRLTDRQRTLLSIAAELFCDEYSCELDDIVPEVREREARVMLRAAAKTLRAGTDRDALFTAKGC